MCPIVLFRALIGSVQTSLGFVLVKVPMTHEYDQGSGSSYHTYEIHISVNHEEWVVERRYSQLRGKH